MSLYLKIVNNVRIKQLNLDVYGALCSVVVGAAVLSLSPGPRSLCQIYQTLAKSSN